MKKGFFLIFLLMAFTLLTAAWVEIQSNQATELYTCDQQSRGAASIEFNLDGYDIVTKTYDGIDYTYITYPESSDLLETGYPDVPVFTRALIIPDQGTPELRIVSFEKTVINDVIIYPEEEMHHDGEGNVDRFAINEEFYGSRGVFPENIAWAGEPAIMRDYRLVPITFCPFQYNAGDRSLTIYSNLVVEVETKDRGGINTKTRSGKVSRSFEGMYKANTLNYDLVAIRDDYQVPTILYICNDNDDVLENLDYLVEWRIQKGYQVTVATTTQTGTTTNSIKNYIQNAYDNWDTPPDYVTIIGDSGGTFSIPTWYSSGGEGDHAYSQLEGNDILGDLILGRITFSTIGTFQVQLNKILHYEQDPYMGDTSWYSRALLTGDPAHSGYSTITVCQAAKELMLDYPGNFWGDDNFVEVYAPNFASQMNNAINLGVSYFGYRGYLNMSGWVPGNTTNGYMMPFAVIPTCGSNDWGNGLGTAEQFAQMGSLTLPSGGIGAVGTATWGTHTPFNNAFALGTWGGIFRDDIFSMGGAILQGKYYLWLTFPQNPGNNVDKFSVLNTLMGEASLELWTGIPQNLSVTYNDVITHGANFYEVTVHDSTGNAAEGAWVTLYKEGGGYTATGYCDSNGSVILDVAHGQEGNYALTVTKHNHIPFRETVIKEQLTQFVEIHSMEYIDTGGNGNGIVNPGEPVELMLTLGNRGREAVSGVNVTMECSNSDVTILTTGVDYGDIAIGEIVTVDSGFELEFASSIQGGVEILMEFTITDADDNEWTTLQYIPVEGASLYACDYTVTGDGIIDPGETVEICFTLENNGEIEAAGVEGQLFCNSRRIEILDSLGVFGTIAAGDSASNVNDSFSIAASEAILPGTYLPFIIHLTDMEGYNDFVTMYIPIGDPEVTDPYGPDEYGYWCYDDSDVEYEQCPEYDWIEIDPDYGGEGTSIDWEGGTATGNGAGTGNYANLELPEDFQFDFYGIEYEEICVCTNGWVAPGYHESGSFMNYPLPGPQGPSPMIAVFWDDLNTNTGDVLWYYDDEHHFYIIEWSHVANGDTGVWEIFEVILYDSSYYPVTTGDSVIKMQYYDVTNNNAGTYPSNHGQYCTIGLENEDSQIGLQYTFNNMYPAACKVLEDETALLFMPLPIPDDAPFLEVSDFYAFSGDDSFIEAGEIALISMVLENMGGEAANDIEVELSINDPYVTMIDNSGSCTEIPAYGMGVLDNAFCVEIAEEVPDFYIFNIDAVINCEEFSWDQTLSFVAYWTNTFSVDQDSIYYELHPQETGSQIFILTNIGDLPVNFYIGTHETTPEGRDISGSNITIDTETFIPGEETTWTFCVQNASIDNEWLCDVRLDFPEGVTVINASEVTGGSGGSLIWDGTTGSGQSVHWHGETTNGLGLIHESETGIWTVDVQLSTEFAGDMTLGWEIGGDGFGEEPHNVTGEIYMLYPLRWINLDTSSGNLEDGEDVEITMNFDTNDIEEGIHTCDIVITCDSWDTKIINVVLNVTNGDDNNSSELPEAVTLNGNYPNPFNPETEIMFLLPNNEKINLSVYNLKGQLVRTLVDNYLPGGSHSIIWDGKTNNGEMVSSGVYFYKLSVGETSETRKMILLK